MAGAVDDEDVPEVRFVAVEFVPLLVASAICCKQRFSPAIWSGA